MAENVKQHIFTRWPKVSLALVVIVSVMTIDAVSGWLLIPSGVGSIRRPHHFYHHGLKPNSQSMGRWGEVVYPLVTNSLGLLDRETREVFLQTTRHRILFMGDSFAEGVGLPFEQTFVGMLHEQLDSERIDVLNGGCIGYSPKLYYLKTSYLLEKGLEIDELVVLVDLSDIPNEVELYRGFESTESTAPGALFLRLHTFLKARSWAYFAVNAIVFKKRAINIWDLNFLKIKQERLTPLQQLQDAVNHPGGAWPEHRSAEMEEGLRLAVQHMQQLADLCRARGIRLSVVIYPWPRQLYLRQRKNVHVRTWQAFALRNGVEFIDLFYDFMPPKADPEAAYRRFFIRGDVHWSAAGHAVVAERLLHIFANRKEKELQISNRGL
jgi:lysophospholipase L1-like esterase